MNDPSTSASTPPTAEPEDDSPPSAEFARALESFERGEGNAPVLPAPEVRPGQRVRGRAVSIGDEHVLVDFGGRSEGVAETRHFRNEDGSLRVAVGDPLDLFVIEAGDSVVLAPSLRAEPRAALQQLRDAQAGGIPVSGRVTALQGGGLAVEIGGVRGFCPVSQIESGFCADPSVHVGHTLEFLVTRVEDARGGVVLSRRQLLRRAEEENAKRLLATLKPGDELDGKVARLEAFGAFVDLGGVDGLVHVSEIRHERTGHPREALREGEQVRVKVLRIEKGKDGRPRLSLSIRAAAPDPWVGVEERFPKQSRVQGTVVRLAEFGAFVSLAPGIDGLVHVSEVAPQRIGHPKEVLSPGQPVEAVVLGVDPAKRRISLSIRQAQAGDQPPPRTPAVGDVVTGRIAGIKPFGVFVDLPDYGARVRGLIPREEAGASREADLARRYPVGEPCTVELYELKGDRMRLRPRAEPKPAPPAAPAGANSARPAPRDAPADEPLTTMAIALRKAMEKAKAKATEG